MFDTVELAAAVDAVRVALERLADLPHSGLRSAGTPALLAAVADLEQAQTVVALVQARVLAEFDVVAPVTWTPSADEPGPPSPGPDQTTAHEIAATLGSSVQVLRDRLATSRVLRDLPSVVDAARSGAMRWWQVRRVAEAVVGLGGDARAEVDRRVAADAAAGRCRNRFGARLGRAVLAADPGRADRAHREGVADRRVTVRPSDAGMAWFGACLPAQDALTVARCLDELAAQPDGALLDAAGPRGERVDGPVARETAGRTADQRRADALSGMARAALEALHDCASGPDGMTDAGLRERFAAHLTGHGGRSQAATETTDASSDPSREPGGAAAARRHASGGGSRRASPRRAPRRRAEIQLVVSAETVLGVADTPGDLLGYGPVGPEQARRIAHLAGTTWRRVITDPVSGAVLDRGRTTYTPPQALADHVRARFGWTCTRPGCSNSAADLDHATAWAESGVTSVDNLHPVCRGCHTAKHSGWTVRIDADGTTTWRTPHGRSASTRPTDHRPEDRVVKGGPGDRVVRGSPACGDGRQSRVEPVTARTAPVDGWWERSSRAVTAQSPEPGSVRPRPLPAPF